MKRLSTIHLIGFLMMAFTFPVIMAHAAESYPNKPISLIIPMEAGADPDVLLRPWTEKVSKILGQPVVIVNKPGGAQTIGYRETYQSKPNGYTIGACVPTIFLAKAQGLFPYDHRDFTTLGLLVKSYPVIISSKKTAQPFTTIQEVFSYAKANPGKIKAATSAVGAPSWLTAQLVQQVAGVQFNIIPQEGVGATILTQVLGGHTDLGFAYIPSAKAQIDAGNIRCLAVVGPERFEGAYNSVPTLKEVGYDASMVLWIGVMGPPKMPKEITEKLIGAFEKASQDPEVRKFWLSRDYAPAFLPLAQFSSFCDEQSKLFADVLNKAGVKGK